jgi:hypothetical protein
MAEARGSSPTETVSTGKNSLVLLGDIALFSVNAVGVWHRSGRGVFRIDQADIAHELRCRILCRDSLNLYIGGLREHNSQYLSASVQKTMRIGTTLIANKYPAGDQLPENASFP